MLHVSGYVGKVVGMELDALRPCRHFHNAVQHKHETARSNINAITMSTPVWHQNREARRITQLQCHCWAVPTSAIALPRSDLPHATPPAPPHRSWPSGGRSPRECAFISTSSMAKFAPTAGEMMWAVVALVHPGLPANTKLSGLTSA